MGYNYLVNNFCLGFYYFYYLLYLYNYTVFLSRENFNFDVNFEDYLELVTNWRDIERKVGYNVDALLFNQDK